jgi:hypothetical protein
MNKELFNKHLQELTVPVKLTQVRGQTPDPEEYKLKAKPNIKNCEHCSNIIIDQVISCKFVRAKRNFKQSTRHQCSCGLVLHESPKGSGQEALNVKRRNPRDNDLENWVIIKGSMPHIAKDNK